MKKGIATFSLDYGKCPRWLFERMTKLSSILIEAIVSEFGTEEFLKRISDPVWFQSFGCLLAFDWNSSGLTVTTTAAIKKALSIRNWDLGIYVCGGKGKASRKTPEEIDNINFKFGYENNFKEISKIVAKIDNSLIQDGFTIYHHSFFFDNLGNWVVIQQGMNTQIQMARRYHWIGKKDANFENFLNDYHKGIISNIFLPKVLNLASKESKENREMTIKILKEQDPLKEIKTLELILNKNKFLFKELYLPNIEFKTHPVFYENFNFEKIKKVIIKSKEEIENKSNLSFIDILKTNIGPKTIRAISLAAEIIYGAPPSYRDPARYTFAHGGKDGTPFFVDIETYDKTIDVLSKAIRNAKILSFKEKTNLLFKLNKS
jgi:hypothetical protein